MSKTQFVAKFKKYLPKLTNAIEGQLDLEADFPRLYQKLTRFYEDRGVQFYDDPEDDYNIILDNVEADLVESGVYV